MIVVSHVHSRNPFVESIDSFCIERIAAFVSVEGMTRVTALQFCAVSRYNYIEQKIFAPSSRHVSFILMLRSSRL